MPLKPDKATVGATVPSELRERIKHFAEVKHWSVAQSLGLFIEAYWEHWEQEHGVEYPQAEEKTSKKSKK